MKKYKIIYVSTMDDDISSVWVEGWDSENAKKNLRREYWDVQEIVSCTEIK